MDWKTIYLTILRDGGSPLLRCEQENEKINYSIDPNSVQELKFIQNGISFLACFDGIPKRIVIYAKDIKGIDDQKIDDDIKPR